MKSFGSPASNSEILMIILFILCAVLFISDIALGPVNIPAVDVLKALTGGEIRETWDYIIINYRMPKAITAMLAGFGLSVSGLMMQTLFRNPLAGPYVLGLTSGASLGVAFVILGAGFLPAFLSGWLTSSYGIIAASWLGSFVVLLAVLLVAEKVRDTMSILIVGLMFGSFTSAIVGVLTYLSSAEQLQKYTFWSMGNLGNLSWPAVSILTVAILIGLFISIFCIKPLDALTLGENYARSLGINFRKVRLLIIIATSILAGSITAFAGPIAFIGLAVPHIARLIFKTGSHRILFWGTLMIGASVMLICDILSQFRGSSISLPINAVTSIVGAPIVIWLLLRKRSML